MESVTIADTPRAYNTQGVQLMSVAIQIVTIGLMFGMTFVIYQMLGRPRRGLTYNREDRAKWNAFITSHSLGGVLTVFNVVGTLTSLAGCYVFLMGSSKLFGYYIGMCSVTLIPGAFITLRFSDRITSSPRIQELLASPTQTGGVIASLFWAEDRVSQNATRLVKWVSLANLGAILWMEFTVFASIGKVLLGWDHAWASPMLFFGCCLAVTLFTLKYGLRGFVFADLFHVPLVALGALSVLVGCILLSYRNWDAFPPLKTVLTPQLPFLACILFAVHNIFINGLQLLTTEGHWLEWH